MKWLLHLLAISISLGLLSAAAAQNYEDNLPADHTAIQYAKTTVDDPVSRLAQQIEAGKARLEFDATRFGYLPSLLANLGIQTDSQALVFSKTGLQATKTSPRAPRAIYFADDVAVGMVQGGESFELAALDPRPGVIFYTLNIAPSERPQFVRRDTCLTCHQGPATAGIPGIYIASVFTRSSGAVDFGAGTIVTDHRTPFEDRWGGWYVTGTHGDMRHRGNAVSLDPVNPKLLETLDTQNLTSLVKKIDANRYLAPTSDLVALMTLEHQTQMTNLMIRAGWQARIDAASPKVASAVDDLVRYMLFADEITLNSPIRGESSFMKTFPQRGPRDGKNRSLREFDLQKRLFRYPLSYMVYSEVFDALPDVVRSAVYQKIYEVLTGKDTSDRFAKRSAQDRTAILEILRETKANLPAYWRSAVR
jgi:hypothetical protein